MLCKQGVAGSIPATSTNLLLFFLQLMLLFVPFLRFVFQEQ
jgi:hypothetical protein